MKKYLPFQQSKSAGRIRKSLALFIFPLLVSISVVSQAQSHTFHSGSYIVNMGLHSGVRATDIQRELKPYGLVYDLIKNYYVPVNWIINPSKAKDGADFTYNGVTYRGGTFVIDDEFITPAVQSRITFWTGQGVRGVYTTSSLTLDVAYEFSAIPSWTLDAQNGSIATGFFLNAGIPATAYNWLLPASLGSCNDIFVMPHADPKWATHGNLYYWNQAYKGSIWLGCHAGSALENMYNPANTSQQCNFLSEKVTTPGTGIILPVPGSTAYAQNSLILWANHSNASIPYITTSPAEYIFPVNYGPKLVAPDDPVAQYIGVSDLAHLNGSEQVYLPVKPGGYRSTTRVVTYDPTQLQVPVNSNGPAVIIAYGRAFSDNNRGWVMYETGHNINSGSAGDVAAQRAFFNWSFLTTFDKAPIINSVTGIPSDGIFKSMPYPQNYPLSVSYTSPVSSGFNSVTWSCKRTDNGLPFGTFSPNGTLSASSTTFTPSSTATDVPCIITVRIVDQCGRTTFDPYSVTISPGPRPPVATPDNATIPGTCVDPGTSVSINALSNDFDPDGGTLALATLGGSATSPYVTSQGSWHFTAGGDVTFYPVLNFFGTASVAYTVCDDTPAGDGGPLCSSSTISVGVGTPDGNGCYPGTTWGISSTYAAVAQTNTGVTNPTYALGSPNYDPADNTTYAVMDGSDILTLDFGAIYTAPSCEKLTFNFASSNEGTTASINVSNSTDGISFSTPVSYSTTSKDPGAEYTITVPANGIRYLRIANTAGTTWFDASQLENYDCVSTTLIATNDAVDIYEDNPTIIHVTDNDVNPGSLPLTLTITSNPLNGKVSLNPDNTVTYLNNTDYPAGSSNATDAFTYQICNSQGFCSSATVNLTIINDNCSNGQYKPLGIAAPTTVTFQAASTTDNSVEDTHMRQSSPTTKYGITTTVEVGKKPTKARRAIFRFNNISTIPANAVVESAVFSIYTTGGDAATLSFNVHRVTETWTENEVTWNNRNSTTAWTSAGGTYNSSVEASLTTGLVIGFKDFSIMDMVQGWIKGPANGGFANNGLLVKQAVETTTDKRHIFASSENSTVSNHPKLVVTYVTPLPCDALVNRNPLANPDNASTSSNAAVLVHVLANDYDVDVPPLPNTLSISNPSVSITSVDGHLAGVTGSYTGAQVGTAVVSGGQILFTPNTAFFGTAVIRYQISDGSLTDETFLYVEVNNAPPVANPDYTSMNSNTQYTPTSATIAVQSNDSNPDGINPLINSVYQVPKNGNASVSGTNIIYTPAQNFTGNDTLIYEVCETADPTACDPTPVCDTSLVVITVNNRQPVANNDSYTIVPCKEAVLHILANDSDPEGGTLTINITQQPSQGTVNVNQDGTVTFTPATNSGSPVTFKYTITDNGVPPQTSAEVTVTITIQNPPADNAPYANYDSWDMIWNSVDYIPVLDNDYDPDGEDLTTPVITTLPMHGTTSFTMSGAIEYMPAPNFNGTDSLIYQVCDIINNPATCSITPGLCDTALVVITVYKPNSPPVAEDDYFTFPSYDNTSYGNVTYNDNDPDNNPLTYSLSDGGSAEQNGTLVFNTDGTFSYLPDNGFSGDVYFTYLACDQEYCDQATVYITIVPLVISGNIFNDANGLSDGTVNGTGIDSPGSEQLYAYLVSGSTVYERVLVQPGGGYTFGTAMQNTTYSVVISTSDVSEGSPAPSPNLPAGWTAVGECYGTNNLSGTGNEAGTPNLSIMVKTGTDNITGVNFGIECPPAAVNDSCTTLVDVPVSGNILINDSDYEGSDLVVSLNTGPGSGTLTLNTDGTFTYINSVAGTYYFTYDVCDPAGLCDTGQVTIVVGPCQGAPAAPLIIRKE